MSHDTTTTTPANEASQEDAGHVHGPGCSHGQHSHSHEAQQPFVRIQAKVGRNDPCPCGSGKKFKKCCVTAPQN